MPITFGIYDFFSYTVPGVLYLVVLNELWKLFLPATGIELQQLDAKLSSALFWLILAYVLGHLMDTIAIRWYTLFHQFHAETTAMHDFKKRNAKLGIDYNLTDRRILFSVIRHHKPELAQFIDNFKAVSIMLNNVSLALFLFGVVELISLVFQGFSTLTVLMAVIAFGLSYLAIRRSRLFNEWHWMAVFEHARQFGRSVPEMFGVEKKETKAREEKVSLAQPLAAGVDPVSSPESTKTREDKTRLN